MMFMVSNVLLSVEYLHSMSCRFLLPLYVVSSSRCPYEFFLYPMALMMSGLRCLGLLCFYNMFSGIIVGCFVLSLSFCRPSCVACNVCSELSSCGVFVYFEVCLCIDMSAPQVHAQDWPTSPVAGSKEVTEEITCDVTSRGSELGIAFIFP